MPAITGSSAPALTDLSERLAAELRAGRPSRAVFGSKDVAFAWTSGVPRTFANFVSTALASADPVAGFHIKNRVPAVILAPDMHMLAT